MIEKILITGASGQLGLQLQKNSSKFSSFKYFFFARTDLDISNFILIEKIINELEIDCIINCAAVTDLNICEKNNYYANLINNLSVKNLAQICSKKKIKLIHISTDYVFSGKKGESYLEDDITGPLNYYGLSKLKGELSMIKENPKNSIIIRTSWLYSNYGINFVKSIISKIKKNKTIKVVENEYGSPTYANDLAYFILKVINKVNNIDVEIFHFSNLGFCSRHELVNEINKEIKGDADIIPVSKNIFDSIKRPKNSALEIKKIKTYFSLEPPRWEDSLKRFLKTCKTT